MNRAEQTHESFHFKKRGEAKIVRLTSQNHEETANAWDRTGPDRTGLSRNGMSLGTL